MSPTSNTKEQLERARALVAEHGTISSTYEDRCQRRCIIGALYVAATGENWLSPSGRASRFDITSGDAYRLCAKAVGEDPEWHLLNVAFGRHDIAPPPILAMFDAAIALAEQAERGEEVALPPAPSPATRIAPRIASLVIR